MTVSLVSLTRRSIFELAVLVERGNTSIYETPEVGITNVSARGIVPLYSASGDVARPVSTTESPRLVGDPAELIGPTTNNQPLRLLPQP